MLGYYYNCYYNDIIRYSTLLNSQMPAKCDVHYEKFLKDKKMFSSDKIN